jgi:predicted MFS family arabinose efflux permease
MKDESLQHKPQSHALEPLTRGELLLLLLLAGVQFTHIMDFMILMPLGPSLMRIFEIEPKQFGLLVSSYNFAAGIAGFIGAFFLIGSTANERYLSATAALHWVLSPAQSRPTTWLY